MHRILVVEDEDAIRSGLMDLLEMEGFEASAAIDGEDDLKKVETVKPHLIILDLMLPKKSGYDVCREVRKKYPETYIMMLTAKTEEISKISGLEMGADDYVTKPFSAFELMARIKSMLRRIHNTVPENVGADHFSFSEVQLDFKRYEATKLGLKMELSAKEFQILRYFSQKAGDVITREELLQHIWGYSPDNMPTTRTVDNQILKLRQKIETDMANPVFIKSVRGVGYKFDPEGKAE